MIHRVDNGACATGHDRMMAAVGWAAPAQIDAAGCPLRSVPLSEPVRLQAALSEQLAGQASQTLVAGPLDRRLVLIERPDGRWVVADLSGRAHGTRAWPGWTAGHLRIEDPGQWLSLARLDDQAVHRFTRPRVLLVALYHPEHFPLPRFPLGISDAARAARSTLLGQISLLDMQLGATLDDVIDTVAGERPDILGISVTFGQHDLMARLLDAVTALDPSPLVVAGGSLVARNEKLLLDRYPDLLIARGAGESTIQDVLAYWHGDLERDQIRGIGYAGASCAQGMLVSIGRSVRHTAVLPNRLQTDILPELDLLDLTFQRNGVAQLETSRGCTNFCSFCPRSHKGQWSGATPDALPWVLEEMDRIFRRHPGASRTIYLVDEEFIGRGPDAVARALAVADTLHAAGFRWETSCRIDQVLRFDRDRDWHLERAVMWRRLCERGLRRCLFGVESGVDSILQRFNKETTGEQNALAIRTLSALGVPTRFTYITFDHLMAEAELHASYAFQGRTDLLLGPLEHLSVEEIVDGVRDPDFVAAHARGRPFYSRISYMLVSMECLIGAAYTRKVQAAGLAGPLHPAMGRHDARFADWRIGACSQWAQRWIDRNFAFDYTLKSLEKILDGQPRKAVRGARVVLKEAAYTVFGWMLDIIAGLSPKPECADLTAVNARLQAMADTEFAKLEDRMAPVVANVYRALPREPADLLRRELTRWSASDGWRMINAADPCGT